LVVAHFFAFLLIRLLPALSPQCACFRHHRF
jgi:hypothetical protein